MTRRGRKFSYLFLILQAAIPQPSLCDDILSKARTANENLYSSLQSFVCHERIDRFRGPLNAATARALDTVTASLSFENGVEHYSDVRQNTRVRDSISNLTGAWSEGEFGTLLLQTETLLRTQAVSFQAFATLGDVATAVYRFDVPEDISPWDLDVGGRHYRLPFRTDVWIATETGEIVKIARTSLGIAARDAHLGARMEGYSRGGPTERQAMAAAEDRRVLGSIRSIEPPGMESDEFFRLSPVWLGSGAALRRALD